MGRNNSEVARERRIVFSLLLSLFIVVPTLQGCVATRDWVNEQLGPFGQRVSQAENKIEQTSGRVDKVEGRLSSAEGRITGLDGRMGEVDAKAERALGALANLRLQRKLVLSMKEGAQFSFNSAAFSEQTKREIDGFLSDLKNDLKDSDSAVFLVAGHTDNIGPDEYNYDLGAKRATTIARYLITQKNIDPTRVVTVSYGESVPLDDNKTRQGREKNRRVEILVYRDAIASSSEPSGDQTANVGVPTPRP